MGTFLKQAKTQSGNGERTRVAVAVPITISAKDKSGRAFDEDSHTIVISKLGVKLVTTHELPIGTEITIQNRESGRSSKGHIVWAADRHSSSEPNEVGAYFPDGELLWGIDLPTETIPNGPSHNGLTRRAYDVHDEPFAPVSFKLPGVETLRTTFAERPASEPGPVPAVAAALADSPAWNTNAAGSPTEMPVQTERHWTVDLDLPVTGPEAATAGPDDSATATLDAALATIARQTSKTAEEQSRAFEKKMNRFAEQLLAGTQAGGDQAAVGNNGSAESRTKAFEERLYAISEEVLSLTHSNVVAAARQAQESATEAHSQQLEENLQKIAQNILARTQENVDNMATRLQEVVAQSCARAEAAGAQLKISHEKADKLINGLETLRQQGKEELTREHEELRTHIRQSVESAAKELNQRVTQQMELMAADLVSQTRERMQSDISTAMNAMIEGEFLGPLHRTLSEFRSTGCEEFTTQLQVASERHRETSLARLKKDSEDTVANALAQIRNQKQRPMFWLSLRNLRRLW